MNNKWDWKITIQFLALALTVGGAMIYEHDRIMANSINIQQLRHDIDQEMMGYDVARTSVHEDIEKLRADHREDLKEIKDRLSSLEQYLRKKNP